MGLMRKEVSYGAGAVSSTDLLGVVDSQSKCNTGGF
jgi:hypothetical protein